MTQNDAYAFLDTLLAPHARKSASGILYHVERDPFDAVLTPLDSRLLLVETALDIVLASLRKYRNEPNERHRIALRMILETMTTLAFDSVDKRGASRLAADLSTGAGKTECVIAWITAVHRLALPLSVMVAVARRLDIQVLADRLFANGVPRDRVGLHFSKKSGKANPYKHAPTDENQLRPILLTTQESQKSPTEELRRLMVYKDQPRSLVCWDESLITYDHHNASLDEAEQALKWLAVEIRKTHARRSDLAEAVAQADLRCLAWLKAALAKLQSSLKRALRSRSVVTPSLPGVSGDDLSAFRSSVKRIFSDSGDTLKGRLALQSLLSMSRHRLRLLPSIDAGAVAICFEVSVPQDLKPIIILDASHPIRSLTNKDASIRTIQSFDGRVKSYEDVTVHALRYASGKRFTKREFGESNPAKRLYLLEVIRKLKTLREDEGVLFATFKGVDQNSTSARGRDKWDRIDVRRVFERELVAAGFDPNQTLPTSQPNEKPKRRFNWLTWGQESSTNEFAFCRYGFTLGILHRRYGDLAGASLGVLDNLSAEITPDSLRQISLSERVHITYQAMSRTKNRNTVNGKALPSEWWIADSEIDELTDALSTIMPGLKVMDWETIYALPPKHDTATKRPAIARVMTEFLEERAKAGEERISTKVLFNHVRRDSRVGEAPWDTLKRALSSLLKSTWGLASGWRRDADGRALVRLSQNPESADSAARA